MLPLGWIAWVPFSPVSQEYWLAVPCIPLIQPHKCCLWALTVIHGDKLHGFDKSALGLQGTPKKFWKFQFLGFGGSGSQCCVGVLIQNLFLWQQCGFLLFVVLQAFYFVSFGFCYSFVLFLFTLVLPVDFVAAGFLKIIWHMFSSTQRKHEFPGRFLSQPCSLFLVFEFFFIKIDYCQSKIMTSSGGLCFFFIVHMNWWLWLYVFARKMWKAQSLTRNHTQWN